MSVIKLRCNNRLRNNLRALQLSYEEYILLKESGQFFIYLEYLKNGQKQHKKMLYKLLKGDV